MSGLLPLLLAASGPSGAAGPTVCWDLESDDGGFTPDEILPTWEWGEPTSGPGEAHGGLRAWATGLDDSYINNNEAALRLPSVDLSAYERPVLSLWHWYRLRPGDEARLEAWTDEAWQLVEPIYGYPGGGTAYEDGSEAWVDAYVDLGGLLDASELRLQLVSDATGVTDGWYVDDLCLHDGDIVPPRFASVDSPVEWQRMDVGPTLSTEVEDDVALTTLLVRWSTDEIPEQVTYMGVATGGAWSATLPALAPGQTVRWSIEASDGLNTSTWPGDAEGEIRIFLPAPEAVSAPEGRQWGTTIGLDWQAPEAEETVVGYRVYRGDALVAEVLAPPVDVPALGPVDTLHVTAVYDTDLGSFEGDASEAVEVEIAVPVFEALSPSEAWQGDLLRIELSGEQLLLQGVEAELPELDLGDGISVVGVEVVNVDRAAFTVQVDADSPTGSRDAVLTSGGLQLTLDGGFTVLDGADRPALLAVSPVGLEQGATGEVRLATTAELGPEVRVDLGEGVVVESVVVEGSTVVATVAVANDAPAGANTAEIDDGSRILQLPDGFRVYARGSSGKGCASSPGRAVPGGMLAALGLLALVGRRRRA